MFPRNNTHDHFEFTGVDSTYIHKILETLALHNLTLRPITWKTLKGTEQ